MRRRGKAHSLELHDVVEFGMRKGRAQTKPQMVESICKANADDGKKSSSQSQVEAKMDANVDEQAYKVENKLEG